LYGELLAVSRGDPEKVAGELIEAIAVLPDRDRLRAPALISTIFETLLPHLQEGSPGYQIAQCFVVQAAGSTLVKWVSDTYSTTTEFFKKVIKSLDMDQVKEFIVREFGNESELEPDQWKTAAAVFEQFPDKRTELREVFPVKTRPQFIAFDIATHLDKVFGVRAGT
jgi:hypothetical protein